MTPSWHYMLAHQGPMVKQHQSITLFVSAFGHSDYTCANLSVVDTTQVDCVSCLQEICVDVDLCVLNLNVHNRVSYMHMGLNCCQDSIVCHSKRQIEQRLLAQ